MHWFQGVLIGSWLINIGINLANVNASPGVFFLNLAITAFFIWGTIHYWGM